MRKITSHGVLQIQEFRNKGFSYKKIGKILSFSPATVLKYGKNVPLLPGQRFLLDLNEYYNRLDFADKFAVEKKISLPALDENLASVLGHLFFDGSVGPIEGRYYVRYINASRPLVDEFNRKMFLVFNLRESKIYLRQGVNFIWHQACFHSKQLCDFLFSYSPSFSTSQGVGVPAQIISSPKRVRASFLRAFWDDEGCISADGDLSGSSVSEKMIEDLVKMHLAFGIRCCKHSPRTRKIFEVYVNRGHTNFRAFAQKIGFSNSLVVRGKNMGRLKNEVLAERLADYEKRLKCIAN